MMMQRKLLVSLVIPVMVTMALLSVAAGTAAAQAWEDHFEGVLDENRWTIEYEGRPGQKFGAPGFIANTHVGYYLADAEHVKLDNGSLRLRLKQEQDGTLVTSSGALIFTQQTYGYGTYEWRMRMSSTAATPYEGGFPTSGGVSAGFIYVNNSETEIDFEYSGHVLQDADSSNDARIYMGNWHNQDPSTDPNEVTESTFSTPIVPGANTDFRTYKFIWKEGKITFFIYDDSGTTLIYQTEQTTNVPSAPAHFMINHWGTNNPNGFGGGATIGVDRYFHVDWVKFTPQEGAPPPPPAPLAAPSSLTAAAGSITTGKGKNRMVQGVFVDLAWQDNSTNEDSFIIERCQVVGKGKNKSCNFVQLVLAGENVTTYHDSGVTGGTTYQYRAKARNANGDSSYSNIGQAKTR